ncbi:MAG: hypothetical protein LW698_03300 [Planctomycetaceae bacterium]|nr:hypothetical protein [Planctomycetaceae bacterium]
MTAMPSQRDGGPPPSRELDDLITQHFDGGLDPAGQRRLAELLAAAPAARATLARYLRLEAALIRLASAGLVGPVAGDDAAVIPRPRADVGSSPWLRPVTLAIAGGTLAAVVIVGLFNARPATEHLHGGEVASVAERWLEVRAADAGAWPEGHELEAHEPEGDEPDTPGGPPAWLVAAMADEELADCGPSLPEQDVRNAERGNPWRFHRSAKWTKAMEGFVHGQLADCETSLPEQDVRNAERGNPWRFHRSAKWTTAMEGFVHGQLARDEG